MLSALFGNIHADFSFCYVTVWKKYKLTKLHYKDSCTIEH